MPAMMSISDKSRNRSMRRFLALLGRMNSAMLFFIRSILPFTQIEMNEMYHAVVEELMHKRF